MGTFGNKIVAICSTARIEELFRSFRVGARSVQPELSPWGKQTSKRLAGLLDPGAIPAAECHLTTPDSQARPEGEAGGGSPIPVRRKAGGPRVPPAAQWARRRPHL